MENKILKENQLLLLTIKRMGINGEGIAYYKRLAVFIPNAIVGEVVEVKITKVFEKYAYGEIVKFKKISESRVKPTCDYYEKCGGCCLQHMDYNEQLIQKRNMIIEAFEKYYDGNIEDVPVYNTIGMENPWFYRNKTQLPTRHDGEKVVVGIYAQDTNKLVYIDKCLIESDLISSTMRNVLDYLTKAEIDVYNPRFRQGNLRYIVIRAFEKTKEAQVTFVLMKEEPRILKILKDVIKIENVKSVNYTINNDPKSIEIISDKVVNIAGSEKVKGSLGDLEFSISPDSFFQLNETQTIKLYNEVKKALDPKGDEKVLDLFCGIGSIGLYLARDVKEVRGIDSNKANILNAREFAANNGITNAKFYCSNILPNLDDFDKEKFKPDYLIIDPPRKGMELKLINYIKKSKIKKIIYVSCNPSTLAKNVNHLQKEYKISYLQPLDMFPHTANVECVVRLDLKK